MGKPTRRIVADHDEKGIAVITMDGPAPNMKTRDTTGITSTMIWATMISPTTRAGETELTSVTGVPSIAPSRRLIVPSLPKPVAALPAVPHLVPAPDRRPVMSGEVSAP